MSQSSDLNISNQAGAAVRAELNTILSALGSQHSGISSPSYALAGMLWVDTSADPLWILKQYDGSSWRELHSVYISGVDAGKIVLNNLKDPTTDQQPATKAFVDALFDTGSWTPSIGGTSGDGSYTYGSRVGQYYKIGKLVFLSFSLNGITQVSSASGSLVIRGFSGTVGTPDAVATGTIGFSNLNLGTGSVGPAVIVNPSQDYLGITEYFDNSGSVALLPGAITSGSCNIGGSIIFRVA